MGLYNCNELIAPVIVTQDDVKKAKRVVDEALSTAHDKHEQLVSYKAPLLSLAMMCSGPTTDNEDSLPGTHAGGNKSRGQN
jgi:hypothetical protein